MRKSEEQRRQGPKVRFDPEPPDLPLTTEQVELFLALFGNEIVEAAGGSAYESEEGCRDGQPD
jgi:hypothetical protein